METMNNRPDFQLLYSAQLHSQNGLSPIETKDWENKIARAYGIHREFLQAKRSLREIDLYLGATYSSLELIIHGGFEKRTLQPEERLLVHEYAEEKIHKFELWQEKGYLRRNNEAEYNKVLKYTQDLQNRRKEGFDVEYELKAASKWIVAFRGWFYANDIEVSYVNQKASGQKEAAKTISEEDLAEAYVNCMLLGRCEQPSQNQLEKSSGIAQSTWSKKLRKPSLLQLIQKRIELVLDSQDFLIHAKTIIEQKAAKARLEDHREKAWGATSEPASALSDEEDRIINDLDNEKIAKMTEAQLMREILQFDPSYKQEDLREYSKEELSTLFRNLK